MWVNTPLEAPVDLEESGRACSGAQQWLIVIVTESPDRSPALGTWVYRKCYFCLALSNITQNVPGEIANLFSFKKIPFTPDLWKDTQLVVLLWNCVVL